MEESQVNLDRPVALWAIVAVAIPIAVTFALPHLPALGRLPEPYSGGSKFPASPLPFKQEPLGTKVSDNPRITNVKIVDLDKDDLVDVLVCDAVRHQILWYRQSSPGNWDERVLAEDLIAPARITVVDLDQDGDNDVIVPVLGNIFPDDSAVGSVVWLEQTDGEFQRHMLLDHVRRVADVQTGDLDGDGDLDIAVAEFGYARGRVLWLENHGEGKFEDHELYYASGTIHVPLADYDGDGDLDIMAVVTQDAEEVWAFENLGNGQFERKMIFRTLNFDIGSAGLLQTDLDSDGDPDLLLPVGDNLEYFYTYPQPYHGCLWLENKGDWNFEPRRIAEFGGTYAASVSDLDNDGDQDVVLISMTNEWNLPGYASVVWLENDGKQNFTTWQIAEHPTHLAVVDCGDLNGDGRDDIVAGGLFMKQFPNVEEGRVTLWLNQGKPSP